MGGTSQNATLRRVTPNGFDVEVPAEFPLLSPADGPVSSDVFGAGYHLSLHHMLAVQYPVELASLTLIYYSKLFIALAASREMASGVDIEVVESTIMPDTCVQFVWQLVADLHVFKTHKKLNDSDTIM